MRLPQARLEQVIDRFGEVEARMGAAADGAEIVRLAREHAELRPVVEAARALIDARRERAELAPMAADADPELAAMARDDLADLDARLPELERSLALLLAPRD